MTRAREVFYLPLSFLTVTLLGGVRIADGVAFAPPPLWALVLAVLVAAALIRCGAVAPERLLHRTRSPLANLSGAVVLLTMFAATVQALNAVVPQSGLPRLVAVLFLGVLLLNTIAASSDRAHVLRSVAVILGSLFVLKFIVLGALSDSAGGWLTRVLLAALDGATLGMLTQPPQATATGYVVFLALALFVAALALLPPRHDSGTPALVAITSRSPERPRSS
jgi:hypothetical protein